MTDLLIRHIRHRDREAYERDGWTVQPYRYGAHHQFFGLLAFREARD